jgi:uncharacterized protein YciI
MLYIIYCVDDPAVSASIRGRLLSEHLEYLERHRNLIVLGGARLAENGQTRLGSTIVLNVPDLQAASAFAENEPFRRAGLYARVEINRMRRGQWYPENVPATVDGH